MFEKIGLILLVNSIFFLKTLGYKYVSDDLPSFNRGKHKNKWIHWLMVLEGHLKSNPIADHAITSLLHTLVCVFIYTGFGATDTSFLAAFLFSFNPINNQGSVWISGRGYVLSALGMTMAMTFPFIGPAFLVLATYSNAGFVAPLVFIGSYYPWFLYFMPFVWMIHLKRFRKNVSDKIKTEMYTEDKKIHPLKIIVAIKTFGFYVSHAIVPFKNTFYHSYMQSLAGSGKGKGYSFRDRFLYFGMVAIGFIVYRFISHPWDMVNFGLLWWCICISPFCNLFRMQQEIAERYCYLPNVGLMIALAHYIQLWPILIPIFITMYATKMWFWMDAYQDDYYLVETSCMNSPDSWFAWHVRAMKRWETQSYQEAVLLWAMARLLHPNEFKVLFNLSSALKLSQRHKEAEDFLNLARSNIPAGQEEQCERLCAEWRKGTLTVLL